MAQANIGSTLAIVVLVILFEILLATIVLYYMAPDGV